MTDTLLLNSFDVDHAAIKSFNYCNCERDRERDRERVYVCVRVYLLECVFVVCCVIDDYNIIYKMDN